MTCNTVPYRILTQIIKYRRRDGRVAKRNVSNVIKLLAWSNGSRVDSLVKKYFIIMFPAPFKMAVVFVGYVRPNASSTYFKGETV